MIRTSLSRVGGEVQDITSEIHSEISRSESSNDDNNFIIKHLHALHITSKVSQRKMTRGVLSYHEAITMNNDTKERQEFIDAYNKELSQIRKTGTWDENNMFDVKSVLYSSIINMMFIFTTKRHGTKKCKCVSRGDQQKPGTYDQDATANTVHH
ncbi:hypothetical protein TBLA_0E02365 [Henningerozyma blattae CBS 6284]|uniref:Uncharacterized protein n=1 Tax=Henningerozyma blattae (strain ATCC 34711 / CBS 6284 / DSM 70876 / NBRC 10599 / NRRL Y-10934 / UCD 77-7) TaxID=1071380 RepID=I2H4J0_HENB6|nr:hypothetical protein TBLA_0E02365 [Tetrapisispora blattae CBS 6284]CCH61292.1 hypothetical protein TBLA_0E02365 [Tetrapisispora blattae CBS 6284]